MALQHSVCLTESSLITHEPCTQCGSRDNLARYDDGHGYCFGCGHYERGDGEVEAPTERRRVTGLLPIGEYRALVKRGLNEETCRRWAYSCSSMNGTPVQIANIKDPQTGEIIAQKARTPDKEFFWFGDTKTDILYGEHLWKDGGRRIVVTEGEIDGLSVSQIQELRWPTVAITKGSKGAAKQLKARLKFLEKFEEVVLMLDNDEAGREAAAECAPIFRPGKAKIALLPLKDPNDMLMAKRSDELITAIFQAKGYRPDGIVTITDIRAAVMREPEQGLPWFDERLTKLTYGRRYGEAYCFGAGTGVGKTDWLTEQMAFDTEGLGLSVGVFALEQQPIETVKRMAGKIAGKRFHVPDGSWTAAELGQALDTLERSGKLFMYDSFGATDWNVIENTIRFLAHSEGVRLFYVDHLTALAAAEEDERVALERIMARMGSIVKELGIIIHLVSHLATPEGTPHEEGGRVMIRHFKGSRAIGFWCHFMFGLERAQQDDDPEKRLTTTFRVLKDRFTGQATGEVMYLGYDHEKGRLVPKDAPPKDDPFKNSNDEDF